ncbi:MAG: hypothetical protein IJP95_07510, partial [Bacteroidales bacterium]|nr:hypothetical protein [Bacteroidales bacterium]
MFHGFGGVCRDTLANTPDSLVVKLYQIHLADTLRDTIHKYICEGQSFSFGGRTLATSGYYTFLETNVENGCLTNRVVHLRVGDTSMHRPGDYDSVVRINACSGTSRPLLVWDEDFGDYQSMPFYTDTTFSVVYYDSSSCRADADSVALFIVHFDTLSRDTVHYFACKGNCLTYEGQTFCESGEYHHKWQNDGDGCWNKSVLYLEFYDTFNVKLPDTNICWGHYMIYCDDTITVSGNEYRCLFKTVHGCDSMVRQKIIIRDTFRMSVVDSVCAGQAVYIRNHPYVFDTGWHEVADRYHTRYGCDSTIVYHIYVNDTVRDTVYDTLCAGQTFDTNGHLGLVPVSGSNYPPYAEQGVYTQYLVDTATHCLHNLVISLVVHDTFRDTLYDTVCAGAIYTIGDSSYTMPGEFPQHYLTVNGCDSVIVLMLTVNDTLRDTIRPVICAGAAFDTNGHMGCTPVNGQNYGPYRLPGVYTQRLRCPDSCFRNLVIMLTVNDTLRDTVAAAICPGATVTINDSTYNTQGVFYQYLRDADSCFHDYVVKVTMDDTIRDTVHKVISTGSWFDTNGHRYSTAGQYTQYLVDTATGCKRNLIIVISISDTVYRHICQGQVFDTNGVQYRNTGVYVQNLTDSLTMLPHELVIFLSVHDTFRDTLRPVICVGGSFRHDGRIFDSTGVYTVHYSTLHGCDSIVVIDLAVMDTVRDTLRMTICAGATFDTAGHSYSQTGVYTIPVPDSSVCREHKLTIILTVNDTARSVRYDTICRGNVFEYDSARLRYIPANARMYDTTIVYRHFTTKGCDSNVVIKLHINDTFRTIRHDTICRGDTFVYGNNLVSYRPVDVHRHDTIITYRHSTGHGCDSTVVMLLHINDTFLTEINRTICRDDSVVDIDNHYTFVPSDPLQFDTVLWFHYQSARNCDSTVVIRVHINDTFRTIRHDTICRDHPFIYGSGLMTYLPANQQLHDTTIHYLHHTLQGCDSLVVIRLHINDTFYSEIYDTICAGQMMAYADTSYSQSGRYKYVHQAANGCDSNVYVNLYVLDTFRTFRHDTICRNRVFTYGNGLITIVPATVPQSDTAIEYRHSAKNGCDSTVVILLHINDTFRTPRYDTICRDDAFVYGNSLITYRPTNPQLYDTTIMYHHSTTCNCDSTVVINIHINDTFRITRHDTTCRNVPFTYGGLLNYHPANARLYDTTITYLHSSVFGCDSTAIILLHIKDTFHAEVYDTICNAQIYAYEDTVYTQTGRYLFVHQAVNGCDSSVYINLRVLDTSLIHRYDTICAGQTFTYLDSIFSHSGSYLYWHEAANGCDSNVIIHLTVNDTLRDTIRPVICAGARFDTNRHQGYVPVSGLNYPPYTVQGVYTQYLRDKATGCLNKL